jgi:hypothetical protein
MTTEQRSKWAYRALMLIIASAVVCGVWLYREKIANMTPPVSFAAGPKHSVEILHFHLPGQPDSETLADHLNHVENRFFGQVLVTRIDVRSNPERVKAEQIRSTPEVIILKGNTTAFRFQGLWPRARIEQRVEEILRGLRRMEKGWMPAGIDRR